MIPGMEPSEKGTLVYPSLQGSTNWASPSYSPATDMLYVPVREMGSIYYKTGVEYKPGTYYTGGSEKRLDEESWGAVRALDVEDRQAGVGLQAAVADLGGRDVHRRRTRVQRIERGQLLRARREDRQAALAVPDRRRDPIGSDVVFSRTTSSTSPSPAVTRCSCSRWRTDHRSHPGDHEGYGTERRFVDALADECAAYGVFHLRVASPAALRLDDAEKRRFRAFV